MFKINSKSFLYQFRINKHQSALLWLDEIFWSEEESEDDSADLDFHFSPTSITPSSSTRSGVNETNKRAALNSFMQLMGSDRSSRSLLVTRLYKQLSKKSKRNFLSSTQFIVDIVLEFLAGSDADVVRQEMYTKQNSKLIL